MKEAYFNLKKIELILPGQGGEMTIEERCFRIIKKFVDRWYKYPTITGDEIDDQVGLLLSDIENLVKERGRQLGKK